MLSAMARRLAVVLGAMALAPWACKDGEGASEPAQGGSDACSDMAGCGAGLDGGAPAAGNDSGGSPSRAGAAASSGEAGSENNSAIGGAGAEGGSTTEAGSPAQAGAGGETIVGCGGIIDDFEDLNSLLCQDSSQNGEWFAWHDQGTASLVGSGVGSGVVPSTLDAPRGTSHAAMHYAWSGTTAAGLGTSLLRVGAQAIDFDATAHAGVTFYAKSSIAIGVSFEVQTSETDLLMYGGTCATGCKPNSYSMQFSPQWTKFQVPLNQLMDGSSPFNAAHVRSINFVSGGTAEIWVDDVAFY